MCQRESDRLGFESSFSHLLVGSFSFSFVDLSFHIYKVAIITACVTHEDKKVPVPFLDKSGTQ